jgi:hypothetical protein
MLTHLHVMVKHLWCWHIRKGGEKDEEEEALSGLVCYHGGHRHALSGAPPPLWQ